MDDDVGPSALGVLGVNHRTAPIEVRERFHLGAEEARRALRDAAAADPVRECLVLSTCNRVELYFRGDPHARASEVVEEHLVSASGLSREGAREYLYRHRGRGVVEHLFRVVAGMDSMVPGEAEIQGQVGDAYRMARKTVPEGVGPVLHRLFQHAQSVGGRIRSETRVGEGAASVPSAAVQLARKVFGSLEDRRALIAGAGEMGKLTLRCLRAEGVRGSLVLSRTMESARRLAGELGGEPAPVEELAARLPEVDILVSCTASPEPILRAGRIASRPRGSGDPLVILDIAVPRDVEPAVGELPEVFLYNIDDLQRVVEGAEEARLAELPRAEAMVAEEAEEFCAWLRSRQAVPLIKALRRRAAELRDGTVDELLEELDSLEGEERERVRAAFRLVMNRFLHAPTVELREMSAEPEGEVYLEAVRRLFDLERGGSASAGTEEPEESSTEGAGSG